jgi:hypothetical protein
MAPQDGSHLGDDDDEDDMLSSMSSGGGQGELSASGEYSISTATHDNKSDVMGIQEEAAMNERNTLGKAESRAIWYLRLLVIVIFVGLAVGTAVTTYLYVTSNEKDQFQSEFDVYADKVIASFNSAIQRKRAAVDSLSVAITSHAISSGSTFPNVTLPHFEYRGSNTRIIGDTVVAMYLPLVTDETREGWEAYSRENNGHLIEAGRVEEQEKLEQDAKYGFNSSAGVAIPDDLSEGDLIRGTIWRTGEDEVEVEVRGIVLCVRCCGWSLHHLTLRTPRSVARALSSCLANNSSVATRGATH